MPAERTVHWGPLTGGDNGGEFTFFKENKSLRRLDIWYGNGSGGAAPYTVLKGIKVTWDGGDEQHTENTPDPEAADKANILHSAYVFENNEVIEWMDVFGHAPDGRADSLRFFSRDTGKFFAAGGTGGEKGIQLDGHKRGILYHDLN
ncbi:predicted protein [Aspergillus terreus NIH2624]|uniref:Jacalin-type lectin domain-containing protein n=1 Tax=Aspergillus terreus (strain NIH 2624 / FGSC A1156) TaxID=341663 RepID=Q0CFZ4_ASPTN|nr:uncharacterized protein ATEG_07398 [Aspergillus terreus NIH2624]EAU32782.1 predicted protein [Aspergillus terreus NIH2624]